MTRERAILTDTTRCVGCEKCVQACKKENGLGPDVARRWKLRIDDLSSTRYTTLIRREHNRFVRQQCRHCRRPACASACIVGALQKRADGPVVYDATRCMGCRYCMMACPYGIPRYDWEAAVPFVRKCTLCAPRLDAGREPACTEACPYDATIFGDRAELVAEAKRRLAAEPNRYLQTVFGETEIGGTSVLYLSDISLDFLGYQPQMGDQPLDQLTWAALSKVPPLVAGVGGLLLGALWVSNRRRRVALEEQAATRAKEEPEAPNAADASEEEEEK